MMQQKHINVVVDVTIIIVAGKEQHGRQIVFVGQIHLLMIAPFRDLRR
jgi:hypothetical protein